MEHKCPTNWISYDALLHWILLATTASIIELCTQFPSVCRGVTLDFSDNWIWFSCVVYMTEPGPILWFSLCLLLQGSPSSDRPWCTGGWGSALVEGIGLAEGAVSGKAAAKRPPVLLALFTQTASDPRLDLLSALQQEVRQLHVWPGRMRIHQGHQ